MFFPLWIFFRWKKWTFYKKHRIIFLKFLFSWNITFEEAPNFGENYDLKKLSFIKNEKRILKNIPLLIDIFRHSYRHFSVFFLSYFLNKRKKNIFFTFLECYKRLYWCYGSARTTCNVNYPAQGQFNKFFPNFNVHTSTFNICMQNNTLFTTYTGPISNDFWQIFLNALFVAYRGHFFKHIFSLKKKCSLKNPISNDFV